jgi:hypothetical protein
MLGTLRKKQVMRREPITWLSTSCASLDAESYTSGLHNARFYVMKLTAVEMVVRDDLLQYIRFIIGMYLVLWVFGLFGNCVVWQWKNAVWTHCNAFAFHAFCSGTEGFRIGKGA